METKEKIVYSALAVILATLTIIGNIGLDDEQVYYCEDRGIVMQCDMLSAYYGLDNGKCWNEEIGNKLCKSGWLRVEKSIEADPKIVPNSQEICNPSGCVQVI